MDGRGRSYPRYLPAPRGRPQQGPRQVNLNNTGKVELVRLEGAENQPEKTQTTTNTPMVGGASSSDPSASRVRFTSARMQTVAESHPGGILRDQHRRRDPGCDHACQAGKGVERVNTRLLMHGEALEEAKCRELVELREKIRGKGWVLKTIMVLLTTAVTTLDNLPGLEGLKPQANLGWCSSSKSWNFDEHHDEFNPYHDLHCFIYTQDHGLPSRHADLHAQEKVLSREQRRILVTNTESMNPDVSEIFSAPRVTKRASKMGLTPGWALDLVTGWDFSRLDHRREALRLVREDKPGLIVLSPSCTAFSTMRFLTNWKRSPTDVQTEETQGLQTSRFCGPNSTNSDGEWTRILVRASSASHQLEKIPIPEAAHGAL